MKLRTKVAILLTGFLLFYGTVDFVIHRLIIFPSFLYLEHKQAIKNSKRVEEAINREIYHLDSVTHDWAAWDDTYNLFPSKNYTPTKDFINGYIEANLIAASFTDPGINLINIYDKDRNLLWGKVYDLETEEEIKLDDFSKDKLPKKHPLLSYGTKKSLAEMTVAGIYMTSKGPMIISSRPILKSDNAGPIQGYFMIGRLLTPSMIKALADQTQVDFKIIPVIKDSMPVHLREIPDQLTDKSPHLIQSTKGNRQLQVFTAFQDIKGKNILLIETSIKREITAEGNTTLHYVLMSTIVIGIGSVIILLLLLNQSILKPVTTLTRHVVEVRNTGDFSKQLNSKGKDEIGILSNEFDNVIMQLGNRNLELETLNTTLQKDIKRRKQAEQMLLEREERLRAIFQAADQVSFIITDVQYPESKVLEFSTGAEKMFGYGKTEMIGKSASILYRAEDVVDLPGHHKQTLDIDSIFSGETLLVKKTGEVFPALSSNYPLLNEKGEKYATLNVSIDISGQKELEAQPRQAAKMEAVGTLASGIAHEFNNMLGVITWNTDLAIDDVPDLSPGRVELDEIKIAAMRAKNVVRQLVSFTRKTEL